MNDAMTTQPIVDSKLQEYLNYLNAALALVPEITELLEAERTRTGLTDEQIFERAGVTLSLNELKLKEDLARLLTSGITEGKQ